MMGMENLWLTLTETRYLDDVQVAPAIAEEKLASLPGYMPGYAPWAYDAEMEKRLWNDSCRILGLVE